MILLKHVHSKLNSIHIRNTYKGITNYKKEEEIISKRRKLSIKNKK